MSGAGRPIAAAVGGAAALLGLTGAERALSSTTSLSISVMHIGDTAEAAELANAAIAGLAGASQARALLLRGSCLLVDREVPAAAAAVWVAASALAEPSQLPADPDGAAVAAELKRLKQIERGRWEREWLAE